MLTAPVSQANVGVSQQGTASTAVKAEPRKRWWWRESRTNSELTSGLDVSFVAELLEVFGGGQQRDLDVDGGAQRGAQVGGAEGQVAQAIALGERQLLLHLLDGLSTKLALTAAATECRHALRLDSLGPRHPQPHTLTLPCPRH